MSTAHLTMDAYGAMCRQIVELRAEITRLTTALPQIIADVLDLYEDELTASQRRFIQDQIMRRVLKP